MTARSARRLPPLEPDAFLCWAYHSQPVKRARWESPLTLEDVHFEHRGTRSLAELRRDYVRIAARARRDVRLGLDPWERIS